jgi:hypothetical protein
MSRPPSALAVAVWIVACSAAPRDPGAQEPSPPKPAATALVPSSAPEPQASSSAPVSPAPIPTDYAAWDDPFPLAELAKDCAWQPAATTQEALYSKGPHPMLCEKVAEQVCAMDACAQSDMTCYPECTASCDGCFGECVGSCESCKQGCTDAACRRACATSCAGCRQECLRKLDHCTTAHCTEVMKECSKDQYARWEKSTCETVCPKVSDCVDKCPVEERWTGGACEDACAKKLMKPGGCPSEWIHFCLGRATPPMPWVD